MPARSATPRTASDLKGDLRYLQRLGARWYARIPVPSHLRKEMGPYVRKALGTGDLREAQMRRWDVMEAARAEFARRDAVGKKPVGKSRHPGEATYEAFRARLKAAGPAEFVDEETGERTENPAFDAAVDALEAAILRTADEPPADLLHAVHDELAGREPVSALLKDYLAHNPKRSATTAANYETTVRLWIEHQGDKPIHRATRKAAVEWLDKVGQGKARDTIKRYATVMSHLWEWSHRLEDVPPASPFSKLQRAAVQRGKAAESYGIFDAAELRAVFAALSIDPCLKAVALTSLYSGMRLSECLAAERLTVEGVECWQLDGGKTTNARRLIPVHPALASVAIPRTIPASTLSVRFGRLMKTVRLEDGKPLPEGKTFHSLRKCFSTALEQAGCPEVIAVRLLGHAPISMSYRVYSAGRQAAELKEWVERVRFALE